VNLKLIRSSTSQFLLLGLLLFACSSAEEAKEPNVTFDGENCIYEGPERMPSGAAVIAFTNLSDRPTVHFHILRLEEDKTWQDVLTLAEEPILGLPRWMRELGARSAPGNPNARQYELEPGLYALLCAQHVIDAWPAAPLEVVP